MARAFELLTNPAVIGGALLLAALLCVLAAGLGSINLFSAQSWSMPQPKPEMARGVAILLGFGVLGAAGFFWRRPQVAGKKVLILSTLLLGLGSSLLIGDWLLTHRSLPAGELVLAVNQEQESYRVGQGNRDLGVMLPLRMTLRGVSIEEEPTAQIVFSRPGQQGVAPRSFVPGQSLDVEGLRFTFAGLSKRSTGYRGVLASDAPGTIEAVAGPGETVKFDLDGPQFRLEEITENYRDLLGPAVKLVDEKGESFWVFTRNSQDEEVPHGIRLKALEQVPAAVMLVSAVQPEWPFMLGLALLLAGAALFFITHRMGVAENLAPVATLGAPALLAVILAAGVGLSGAGLSLSATTESALGILVALGWTLAFAALLGAGVQAEQASQKGRRGLLTAGVAALATALAVTVLGILRGRLGETGFGLPLTADGAPVMWGLPESANLGALQLPLIANGDTILGLLAGIGVAIVIALVATFQKKDRAALIAWVFASIQSLGAAFSLLSSQTVPQDSIATGPQKLMALQYLRAQNLPPALAERGAILANGELKVDSLALLPEVGALFFIALISAAAAFIIWKGKSANQTGAPEESPATAPGLFAPALTFAILAWSLGLLLSLSQIGSAGILAPMEWVGLSAPIAMLGFLMLGQRQLGDETDSFLRRFMRLTGPALALIWLIIVWAAAAAALALPGASLPVF